MGHRATTSPPAADPGARVSLLPRAGSICPLSTDSVLDGFGFELETTIGGVVAIDGQVTLDPNAYVDWDLDWGGLHSAAYTQALDITTDLDVSIKKELTGEKEMTLYGTPSRRSPSSWGRCPW